MEGYISKTFNLLKKLNEVSGNKIFTLEEIEEQEDNIRDLPKDINAVDKILNILNTSDYNDGDILIGNVFDLHIAIDDIEWQYDQIHIMVRKVIAFLSEEDDPIILKTLVYDEVEDETED